MTIAQDNTETEIQDPGTMLAIDLTANGHVQDHGAYPEPTSRKLRSRRDTIPDVQVVTGEFTPQDLLGQITTARHTLLAMRAAKAKELAEIDAAIGSIGGAPLEEVHPVVAAAPSVVARKPRASKDDRLSADLSAAVDAVVGLVRHHPKGIGAQAIRGHFGWEKSETVKAIKAAVTSGALTVTGNKRSTTYHIA